MKGFIRATYAATPCRRLRGFTSTLPANVLHAHYGPTLPRAANPFNSFLRGRVSNQLHEGPAIGSPSALDEEVLTQRRKDRKEVSTDCEIPPQRDL